MAGGSPLGSPVTARRTEPNGLMDPALRDQLYAQQLIRATPSYAVQQQMLQVINTKYEFLNNVFIKSLRKT